MWMNWKVYVDVDQDMFSIWNYDVTQLLRTYEKELLIIKNEIDMEILVKYQKPELATNSQETFEITEIESFFNDNINDFLKMYLESYKSDAIIKELKENTND